MSKPNLTLCRSNDGGWSLHGPTADDARIAAGDDPYLLCGGAQQTDDGWDRPNDADYAEAEQIAAERAAQFIDSTWDRSQQECIYYDDATGESYRCDELDDMLYLYQLIHDDDPDVRRDAYSHWCAGTSHEAE